MDGSSVELIRQRQRVLKEAAAGGKALPALIYDEHVSQRAEVQDFALIACIEPRLSLVNLGHQFGKAVVGRIPGAYIGPYRENSAEAATVAIALKKGVSDIVVMGHTDCGAMTCCCKGHEHADNDGMGDVLGFLAPLKDALKKALGFEKPADQHRSMAQDTVCESLKNLENYPGVQERIRAGTLRIHGWLLDLDKAHATPPQPFLYELDHGTFRLMADSPAQESMQGIETFVGRKNQKPGPV